MGDPNLYMWVLYRLTYDIYIYVMHNALYKYKYKGNIYMLYFHVDTLVESPPHTHTHEHQPAVRLLWGRGSLATHIL